MTVALLLFTGFVVGILNAIVDGGTLLMFPILIALGLPALAANATTYVAVLPGRLSAVIGYKTYLKKLPPLYIWLLIPCISGALIGAYLLRSTSSANFKSLVPVLIIAALLLLIMQPWVKRHLIYHMDRRRKRTFISVLLLGLAILAVSVYGGYFGAGLGFALVALLGFSTEFKMHSLNAIKNIIGIVVSVIAISFLLDTGTINWQYGLLLALGNLVGGYCGARIATKVASHNIRHAIVVFGICITVYLLYTLGVAW